MLNDQQISQSQKLYKKRYGITISKEVAIEKGTWLINLIRSGYRP